MPLTLHWGGPAEMGTLPVYALPVDLNYAGVWNLSEDAAAAVPQFKDGSSAANHAEWRGTESPGITPGLIGNAVQLDGISQAIHTCLVPAFNLE